MNKGLLCLKPFIGNLKNTYTTALLAYTFSLAGKNDIREQLLNKLESVATSGGTHLTNSISYGKRMHSRFGNEKNEILYKVDFTVQCFTT